MKRFLKVLPFLVPFVLGFIGFVSAGEAVLDSAFKSVLMYFLNYSGSAPNLMVEIARWIAPVATAGGLFAIILQYATSWRNIIRNRRKNSVAVYGDSAAVLEKDGSVSAG